VFKVTFPSEVILTPGTALTRVNLGVFFAVIENEQFFFQLQEYLVGEVSTGLIVLFNDHFVGNVNSNALREFGYRP
jgi:hypothetical protein